MILRKKIENILVLYLCFFIVVPFVLRLLKICLSWNLQGAVIPSWVWIVSIVLLLLWLIDLLCLIVIYIFKIKKSSLPSKKKFLFASFVIFGNMFAIPILHFFFLDSFNSTHSNANLGNDIVRMRVLYCGIWFAILASLGIYYMILRDRELRYIGSSASLSPLSSKLLIGFGVYNWCMGIWIWRCFRKRPEEGAGKMRLITSWASFDAAAIVAGLIPAWYANNSSFFIPWILFAVLGLLLTHPFRRKLFQTN